MKSLFRFSIILGYFIFSENVVGQPTFLADPNSIRSNQGSYPHGFIEWNSDVFFSATDRIGPAIWKSNGTEPGTHLIKRSMYMGSGAVLNNSLIIIGSNMQNIVGIWKTDGTSEGTVLVKQIKKMPYYIDYSSYRFDSPSLTIKNSLYGIINGDLWKIDGTSDGTFPIKSSCLGNLANIDTLLYFFSITNNSVVLNKTNGIKGDTTVIQKFKHIPDYDPVTLVSGKDKLYFFANNDTSLALYSSDGTTLGTQPIWGSSKNITYGFCYDLVLKLDTLYFASVNKIDYSTTIWRYSGNKVDTVLHFQDKTNQLSRLVSIKEAILALIETRDSWGQLSGVDIWRISAHSVTNSGSLSNPEYYDLPIDIKSADSVAYFYYQFAVWKTDGIRTTNITPDLSMYDFTLGDKYLYFAHRDDSIETEPWLGSGAVGDNRLIKDVNQEPVTSRITQLAASGDRVYFSAEDLTHGFEPWVTDCTQGGTFILKDIYSGTGNSYPHQYFDYNNNMYFMASKGNTMKYGVDTTCYLWKTDGTTSGTITVKKAYNYYNRPYSQNPVLLNDKFYFGASVFNSYPPYPGVWISDGTSSGTYLLKAVNDPYFGSQYPFYLTKVGNSFFFAVKNNEDKIELWKSDGRESGTIRVKTNFPGLTGFENMNSCIGTSSLLFFSAQDAGTGMEPWISDGTDGGTHILADINPGLKSSDANFIGSVSDKALFSANDGTDNYPLYASDGTSEGTTILKSFSRTGNTSILMDGKLYFPANDSIHGWELWCTDGTSDNTYMIRDIIQGSDGSVGGHFCLNNGILYFDVNNPDGTSIIWSTDGTSANTVPLAWNVQDIAKISAMTSVNNNIVFSATDEIHGNCLYSYKLNYTSLENPPVKDMSFTVYPNPAKDRLWIKWTGTDILMLSQIFIINIDGKVIRSIILPEGDQSISISDLPKGIYIIRLGNTDRSLIQQFIKL